MSDPTIERIEADLRESQFKPWDAETFLAGRHQAKIEELNRRESTVGRLWAVTKDVGVTLLALVGGYTVFIIICLWLLYGEFPIQRGMLG